MTTRPTDDDQRRRSEGLVFLVLFALTIPLANWMIGHVGTMCVPHGPCLIPVAPRLMAPSGVTHDRRRAGAARSGAAAARRRRVGAGDPGRRRPVGAARPAGASDRLGGRLLPVRTGRSRRLHAAWRDARLVAAVVASSAVGLVVDSIVFLWLAFGSLDFLAGQVVGKAWMVARCRSRS